MATIYVEKKFDLQQKTLTLIAKGSVESRTGGIS